MPAGDGTIVMEGVTLTLRNFSGKKTKYNPDGGVREFAVIIPTEKVDELSRDGWNVKQFNERESVDEGAEPPDFFLPVKVKYGKGAPPRVVLITERGRTNLGENEIGMLDWADIINVDLIVRPFSWDINEKTGITAYLKSLYVTIEEDPLERKYAELDSQ